MYRNINNKLEADCDRLRHSLASSKDRTYVVEARNRALDSINEQVVKEKKDSEEKCINLQAELADVYK